MFLPWRSRKQREDDFERELRADLELEAEERHADGLSPDEARYAAQRALGNTTYLREEVREMQGFPFFERLWQDLRFAARSHLRSPGFALIIILSLALGIGANTAIFSVLNAVLLRPLPVANPSQLFSLEMTDTRYRAPQRFSYPLFLQMRDAAPNRLAACSRVARMYGRTADQSEQQIIRAQLISSEYFPLLGISPARGRFFDPSDNRTPGQHPVAIVSDAYWRNSLGSSSGALGRTIDLNGTTFSVVGIAPPGFNGLWLEAPVDVWIPLMMQSTVHYQQNFSSSNGEEEKPWLSQDGIRWLDVLVRTGHDLPVLQGLFARNLQSHISEIEERNRPAYLKQRLTLEPLGQGYSRVRQQITSPLYALSGMVALVLLIACSNSVNLILARGAARRREIAVRLSVGAGRGRIIRQLLTETCLLVAIAAALGLFAADLGANLLVRAALGITSSTSTVTAGLDGRVLAFTLLAALITAVLCGLLPALRATKLDLEQTAKLNARSASGSTRGTPQRYLVAAQIALVFVLLVTAAWFSASLRYLARLNLGYEQDQVVTVWLRPELAGYAQDQLPALHRRLVENLESIPGVQSAVYAMCGLASGCQTDSGIVIDGYQPTRGEDVRIEENRVGPHYFSTVGMRLIAGRDFTAQDREHAPLVAVVNQSAARRFFGGEQAAIGRKFGYDKPNTQIVGIVADSRVLSEREPAQPMAFYALPQSRIFGGCVEVRVSGNAEALMRDIRQSIVRNEPRLPIDSIRTVRNQVNGNLGRDRLVVWLASVFGALALALACFGIYGTMSYSVARRTNEIGIRMALGAMPARVFRLVFAESLTLLALGLLAGAPLVFAASRAISKLVLGVNVNDPLVPLAAALVVTLTAALAVYLPSRRAARVDPIVSLRYE